MTGRRAPARSANIWGNVPQVLKAYAWARAMGAEGINEASDLSVLANNYMDEKLGRIRGLTRSNPRAKSWRMEMTRWGLGKLKEETGVGHRRCRQPHGRLRHRSLLDVP